MSASSNSVLEIVEVADALGVVLPREILADLGVEKGGKLFLTRTSEGYRLTRSTPEFERQMTVARSVMRRRRNVLRELAK